MLTSETKRRIDVDGQVVKLSKVSLFLHGFPDPAIHIYDTLSNDARWRWSRALKVMVSQSNAI